MGAARVSDSGDGRGRLLTMILVGSVVVHLGTLTVLGLRAVTPETQPPIPYAPIFVEMEPRPMLRDETARRHAPTPDAAATAAARRRPSGRDEAIRPGRSQGDIDAPAGGRRVAPTSRHALPFP